MAVVTGPDWRSIGRAAAMDRCRGRTRTSASPSRTTCPGRRAGTATSSGLFVERDSKTEPGSNDYNGVYNFGHSADNPLSTGNGYANALLGVFTRYDERDFRVDAEVRHWQWDAYAQDSWRLSPRFTMDYGLRVTHHGAVYETREMNSAFDPDLWQANQAAVLYRPFCRPNGVAGQPGVRRQQPRGDQPDQRQHRVAVVRRDRRARVRQTSRTGSSRAVSPARRAAGTTTCPRCRGRLDSALRGTSPATRRPRSAPRAGSSTTSSTAASISTTAARSSRRSAASSTRRSTNWTTSPA